MKRLRIGAFAVLTAALGSVCAFADLSFAPMFMFLGIILVAVIAIIVIAAVLLSRKSAERRRMAENMDFAEMTDEDDPGREDA